MRSSKKGFSPAERGNEKKRWNPKSTIVLLQKYSRREDEGREQENSKNKEWTVEKEGKKGSTEAASSPSFLAFHVRLIGTTFRERALAGPLEFQERMRERTRAPWKINDPPHTRPGQALKD